MLSVRNLSLAVLALALAVSFTATRATGEEAAKGTISGKITKADGSPAGGAKVGLMNQMAKGERKNKGEKPTAAEDKPGKAKGDQPKPIAQTEADSEGNYTLSEVPAGKYVVRAGIKGVGQARQPVEVKAGETATVDLKLEAPKAK